MLKAIQDFFSDHIQSEENPVHPPEQLAAAALLIEVIEADDVYDEHEKQTLYSLLEKQYHLDKQEVDKLVEFAHQEVKESSGLFQFTSLINEHFSPQQKTELIYQLWLLAYADGNIDKHEEHTIRRIADLIYVSHTDFIKSKSRAKNTSV